MEIHQNIISRITGSFDLFIFIFPNILYVVPFLKKKWKMFSFTLFLWQAFFSEGVCSGLGEPVGLSNYTEAENEKITPGNRIQKTPG